MYFIVATKEQDYQAIFALMKHNMFDMQAEIGIEWNQTAIEENYRDKLNYTIFNGTLFAGFISVEYSTEQVFIHTLQIAPVFQNTMAGYSAMRYVCQLARQRNVVKLGCCVFDNNPAKNLYLSLGFREVLRKGCVLTMQLDLRCEKIFTLLKRMGV